MNISKNDERLHPHDTHAAWNESYYCNFQDSDGKWSGAVRISFPPNQGHKDGFLILFLPDGTAGFIRCCEDLSGKIDTLSAGAFEHQCIEPFQKWRVRYKGPFFCFEDTTMADNFLKTMLVDLPRREIELDLNFTGFHEPYNFHHYIRKSFLPMRMILSKLRPSYFLKHLPILFIKVPLLLAMGKAGHYEQAGHIKGTITVDGEMHPFTGTGQRDHSWGVRDMRVITHWQWFSCQFGEELAFNATRVEILGFQAIGGHAFYKGKCHSLRNWHLDADYDPTNKWAQTFKITLCLDTGEKLKLSGKALKNLPTMLTTRGLTAVVNEARSLFQWEGKESFGISEFMGQVYP